jgi:PH domain/C2 domain/PX domain/Permuted papain-like amidase enzyme, YaeF/YiiX, C92 family
MSHDLGIRSGYLIKKGQTRHSWKLRWFILTTEWLYYYDKPKTKDGELSRLKGKIAVGDILAVVKRDVPKVTHPHWFDIVTAARVYPTRASSDEERDAWIRAIGKASSQHMMQVEEEIFVVDSHATSHQTAANASSKEEQAQAQKENEDAKIDDDDNNDDARERKTSKIVARKRITYLDVVIVEGREIMSGGASATSGFMGYFTAKSASAEPDPFLSLSVGVQEFASSVIAKDANPLWNEDCTFTYEQEDEPLRLLLYDKNNRMLGSDEVLGRAEVPLDSVPWRQIYDVWIHFNAIEALQADGAPAPPQLGIGVTQSEPALHSAAQQQRHTSPHAAHGSDAQLMQLTAAGGESNVDDDESTKRKCAGRVHLLLFKSHSMYDGILAHYGRPMKSVALRLGPGDLILVSSPATVTHAVKLATSSQWDHIAMVTAAPGKRHRLRLYEATMEGIHEYALDYALAVYHSSSKIAVRRLQVEPTADMLASLQAFIGDMRGRPYKTDYWQILRAASASNKSDDLSSMFCSQLVAAAYQRMGLLDETHLTNNFVPGDFAFECGSSAARVGQIGKLIVIAKQEDVQMVTTKRARGDTLLDADAPDASSSSSSAAAGGNGDDDRPFGLLPSAHLISRISVQSARNVVGKNKKKFTMYSVECETEGGKVWSVWRRFNAFVALDTGLRKRYKGIRKLPPKTFVRNRFDENVIKNRCAALHSYLQPLIKGPTARDIHLLDFVCAKDHDRTDFARAAAARSRGNASRADCHIDGRIVDVAVPDRVQRDAKLVALSSLASKAPTSTAVERRRPSSERQSAAAPSSSSSSAAPSPSSSSNRPKRRRKKKKDREHRSKNKGSDVEGRRRRSRQAKRQQRHDAGDGEQKPRQKKRDVFTETRKADAGSRSSISFDRLPSSGLARHNLLGVNRAGGKRSSSSSRVVSMLLEKSSSVDSSSSSPSPAAALAAASRRRWISSASLSGGGKEFRAGRIGSARGEALPPTRSSDGNAEAQQQLHSLEGSKQRSRVDLEQDKEMIDTLYERYKERRLSGKDCEQAAPQFVCSSSSASSALAASRSPRAFIGSMRSSSELPTSDSEDDSSDDDGLDIEDSRFQSPRVAWSSDDSSSSSPSDSSSSDEEPSDSDYADFSDEEEEEDDDELDSAIFLPWRVPTAAAQSQLIAMEKELSSSSKAVK